MVGAITGIKLSARVGQIALAAAPWVGVFVLGFAAAELYEHKVPWGLDAKRNALLEDLGDMRADRDAWKEAAGAWQVKYDGWVTYARGLEAKRSEANDEAADEVGRCSAQAVTSSSKAFDNGYVAGRAAGRRSCGATDATSTSNDLSGRDVPPGGVQPTGETLSGRWGDRAYRPAGALPTDR